MTTDAKPQTSLDPPTKTGGAGSPFEVLGVFLRLGCTSFGGPIAHLGYFQKEIVERRKWCSEDALAEMIALAQSLPGPASSQVGFALGILRAGWLGGLAAWVGFTLPSALLMIAFAFGHSLLSGGVGGNLLHGLQLVAVAVVAQAVAAMRASLAPDRRRLVFALLAAGLALAGPPAYATLLAIAAGALFGLLFLKAPKQAQSQPSLLKASKSAGFVALAAFLLLLVGPPLLLRIYPNQPLPNRPLPNQLLVVFSTFYQTGALVFGGGHVVLPLLEHSAVASGWVTQPAFLAGYGAAQALPGPLFTFAAYLGAVIHPSPSPILYGLLSLFGIFAPGLLAMAAILPFWSELRRNTPMQAAIRGINAAVVGVLMAALYHPLWTSTVHTDVDFWVVLIVLALLLVWKTPPWIVVVGTAVFSLLMGAIQIAMAPGSP